LRSPPRSRARCAAPVRITGRSRPSSRPARARRAVTAPHAREGSQSGDLVHAEFAGVEQRYHAVTLHTFALGDPGRRARELYELCRLSLEAGERACKIGTPVAAVEEASLEPLRAAGLEDKFLMRFGYGIGIAYPPIWLEALEICRESNQIMQANTSFVLHSCVELEDEGIGIIQGGTYALTEDGLELLTGGGAVPLEIL
jgi:Xaa-Pro dipeptidase